MELYKKNCVPCRGDIPPFTRAQIDEYLRQAKEIADRAASDASQLTFGQAVKKELMNSSDAIQNILNNVFDNAGILTDEQAVQLDEEMRLAKKRLLESQQKLTIQRYSIIGGVGLISLAILWYLTRNK